MRYYLYVLQSERSGRFYIGSTGDVDRRLAEHNRGKVTSTRSRRPWTVVHQEAFATRAEAVGRERQLKRLKSRRLLQELVDGGA